MQTFKIIWYNLSSVSLLHIITTTAVRKYSSLPRYVKMRLINTNQTSELFQSCTSKEPLRYRLYSTLCSYSETLMANNLQNSCDNATRN